MDAIPAAVEKPTPPEVIVPVEKGKETQRLQVVTAVASTTVASTTIGPSDADIALRYFCRFLSALLNFVVEITII